MEKFDHGGAVGSYGLPLYELLIVAMAHGCAISRGDVMENPAAIHNAAVGLIAAMRKAERAATV